MLAACSLLPLVPSPAMTVVAILLVFLHYKAVFWFEYWYDRTYFTSAAMLDALLAEAAPAGLDSSLLGWLSFSRRGNRRFRGQAIFFCLMMYGGGWKLHIHLFERLVACILSIPSFFT